jgi:peptidoglycan/LPS O-acetylase OafA/YrhL
VFGSRTGELLWFARALVGVCSLFFGGMELLLGLVSLRLRPPASRKALAAGTGIALVVTAIQVMLGGFRDVSAVMLTAAGAVLLFLVVDIGANRRATPKRRDG